ncbi:MAG: DUF4401 domain-containing protein [Pelobium sp.]
MRNKESIAQLLGYFQSQSAEALNFDQKAIEDTYENINYNQTIPIKILSIIGGILITMVFIAFLWMFGLWDSKLGLSVLGFVLVLGAILVNKFYDKVILDTLSISGYVGGFILIALGLDIGELFTPLLFIAICLITMAFTQNYILSFVNVFIINASLLALIYFTNSFHIIHLYVSILALLTSFFFLKEAKLITLTKPLAKLYAPIRIGLLFSFLGGLIILSQRSYFDVDTIEIAILNTKVFDIRWLSSIVIILSVLFFLKHLFKILNIEDISQKLLVYGFTIVLLAPTAISPGISGAVLIILLSFLINYKTGFVIGIAVFIYFISRFYYDLNYTLLTKSILLFSSGILFLGFYFYTQKNLNSHEKI